MPLELWGATGSFYISLPNRPLGYLLLIIYLALLGLIVHRHQQGFRSLSPQQWRWVAALAIASFLASQLFPIHLNFDNQLPPLYTARNPVTVLTLFSAAPFLLAGAILNPAAAFLVGMAGGLGQSLGQSHQIFDIFHVGFAAVLAAMWLEQNYLGRINEWLRHPVVSGALSSLAMIVPIGIETFVTANANASYLVAMDLAFSTTIANIWPLLIEGTFGGGLVWVILQGMPHLRPQRPLLPSPVQRSLRSRLLNNFTIFAVLLTLLVSTVVFRLAVNVSTQLVINQMAHNAKTVSAEIPDFQAHLQNLLTQYTPPSQLLTDNETEVQTTLRQLFRVSPLYRRVMLVNDQMEVVAFYPPDVPEVQLTDLEQTAVAETLTTGILEITPAQTEEDESIISFAAPLLNEQGEAKAVLVGRVPEISLENLITGVQGTVGEGTGFIVDENGRIIAHANHEQLLNYWTPPDSATNFIETEETSPGFAYQGLQGTSNARELVYYITGPDHQWTVVVTVPYEVVLRLALNIGGPLMIIMLVVISLFYINLAYLGHDITKPITELVEASRTIAAGGNWTPPSADTIRDDEVGQLHKAFAQMQRSMKQRLNELSLLLSVSHDVSSTIDIGQGMPTILRGALRGTGASGARAVVINPAGGRPLTFGEGPAARIMTTLDRNIMLALRDLKELMLETPEEIRSVLQLEANIDPPIPALIALPLVFHDRFQGVLWLGYRQPHSFDLTERNLLRTLASQAAILVENARLFATAEGGRRRLAAVLASTTDAVIVTDQTERVLLINRAMERIFNIKAQEVINRHVADVIDSEILVKALTAGEEHMRNLEIRTEDGRIFYTNASAIISNDGQALGRVAVLHDITHFKEIDELKSDFVQTVSHDLRGPLTFMRGYATMIPMVGELNDKQKEYMDKILSGIDQMAKLVNDLLDLGRIEAGVELQCVPVDVHTLLTDIAEEYWQHAHLNGIQIEVNAPENIILEGDKALIKQAITNLVSNGLKYAPNSGRMVLQAEQRNGEVIISVQDNGPGIPKEDQMRLFEKFYRARQRGTEKIKGSGLGLAIVKSIAERHGGRVWVHSQQGKGSTFYIALPLQQAKNGRQG
ncbi:MAG: PAS domain-containing protein [Chloroflexi bacterium]|nr:MAG: PAS domain-containing protein [Chloroflexota bacterium]